jgi:hypothetical protein
MSLAWIADIHWPPDGVYWGIQITGPLSSEREGFTMKITKIPALAAVPAIALGAAGLAACSTTTVHRAVAAVPATTSAPAAAATSSPASSAPATSAPPSNTGPIATTFTVTGTDNNGNASTYNVTAVRVDQHSSLLPYDSLTNPADHLAAVEFRITGVTGQSSDDANSDAQAFTGNTEQVSSAFNQTPDGGNWNSGEFTVAPGQTASGWVTFELPPGQTVASVQWAPGFSGQAGTWTVTPAAPQAAPATAPAAPQAGTECAPGLFVNAVTSCPFADNVDTAYAAAGVASGNVSAYSPVTGMTYTMYCNDAGAAQGTGEVDCTGGANSLVVIDG